jgi:hypothetical protein
LFGALLAFALYALGIDFKDLLEVIGRPFAFDAPAFLTGLIFPTPLKPASSTSWGKDAFVPAVVICQTQQQNFYLQQGSDVSSHMLRSVVFRFMVFEFCDLDIIEIEWNEQIH